MRTFVIGDIHGAYKAFKQCLKKADFNYRKDKLICLGDVCDRGTEVNKVFDLLLKINNLVYILGNHDYWALEWAKTGKVSKEWKTLGALETLKAYPGGMPIEHINLLRDASLYYLHKKRLFVHGGIKKNLPLKKQGYQTFLWDRSLVTKAMEQKLIGKEQNLTKYKEIFIGHTPTLNFNSKIPVHACEVWLMDTGAGWGEKLSIMNIKTKEIIQSKRVEKLYPGQY
ncbi:MAG: fructose-bisphosphatase class III [Bacteroidales bacterium]|nr:fructose-bisphosphatase class III [Bacteroidales bacterium]